MSVTRRDVAKYAGVSEQTVSYIINNSRKFSKDVEDNVRRAIRELNYEPDMMAKSMVTKRSKSVSIVVNDIANPIFGEIVKGFEFAAGSEGYWVGVIDAVGNLEKLSSAIVSRRIEGVYISLISAREMSGLVKQLLESGVKVVLGNDILKDQDRELANVLEVNLDEGIKQVLSYLKSLGHKDIVYLSGLSVKNEGDYRCKAFLKNYREEFGCEGTIIENEYPFETTVESGYAMQKKLLESKMQFSAVIATNDLMAYGCMQCLRENGIRVPQDVSVVGIDDIFFSKHANPPLTSLGFDKFAYGKRLFEVLKENIEKGSTEQKKELFACTLEIRGSTAQASGK